MLRAFHSASARSRFFLLTLAGLLALSLGLSGCAGIVSPSNGEGSSNPGGTLAISNVQASGATNTSVQLNWTTNEASTSAIDYGTTSVYGVSTPVSSKMVTAHQMTLSSLAQGTTYHFRVRSTTSTDNASSSDQTFSTTGGSNTPPSVQITSPAVGATLSGKVNLTAVASDNGSVKGVQFRVDGGNVGPDVLTAPYLYVLDSSTLSNGSHSISAIATDNTGTSTTSASVVVKVDNSVKDTTPPTVSITAPANGAKISGVVNVTASATDNVSVASVKFEIDGAVVGAPDLAAPFAYSWDTSKSSNGGHTLKAIATDGAGNSTTSAAIMVTVNNAGGDKTAPTVSIIAPAAGATVSGTVNATATASDNVGIASVQFQVDGVNAGAVDGAAPYVLAWDTTRVANGAHRLDAIAKDAAGNATTSASISVTVNNAAAKNFSISGTVSGAGGVGATVTLSGAGVAAVTTNASGAFTFTGLAKGTYTITPSHTGFTFNPGAQNTTITAANVTGVNFASTAVSSQTFSISGTISGAGGVGATVSLTGTSVATTTANASGGYTFTGLAKGNYTLTPSHTGFTFSPGSLAESISTTNITNANFTATASTPQTFSITGTIGGTGGSGTTVTLTGTSSATTTANASGVYTFTGLAKGSYTVKPTHTGFTFSPVSLAESITTANISGANFTATATVPQTFSITGTISGSGGSGATVKLTGTSTATVTANASGVYTFTGLAKGSYTVTPSHTGFTFSPTSLAEAITTTNITGANFTATASTPQTFTITGTVSGTGGSGTTLTLSGAASQTTTANASGAFTFNGLAKGTYAITPSHSGFTFTPTSASATINTANVTGVNFTAKAAAATFSISGTITPSSGGSGATVTLSGAAGATTTTNASGTYTFANLANGNYVVTPSNSGFTFTPGSTNVTLSGANKTGVNFTAASNAPHSVTLNWNASTSKVSGYNVYRSTTSSTGGFTKINSSLVTTTSYEDSTVQNGKTYFYVTTSVDASGTESSDSNSASVTIP